MTHEIVLTDDILHMLDKEFSADDVARAVLTSGFNPHYFTVGSGYYSGKHLQSMAKLWLMRDEILAHLEDSAWEGSDDLYDKLAALKEK